jgi:hypothetical protein
MESVATDKQTRQTCTVCGQSLPARICEIPATKTLVGELKSYRLDHEFREFSFLSEKGIGQPGHAK